MAQGFSQVYKIDYIKTFAPIIRWELLRIFLAIAVMLRMILVQMDVIGGYLESRLS